MAKLRLDGFENERQALADPNVWEDVLRMIAERKMPPPGSARPSPESYARVSAWIESRLDRIVAARKLDPGRVTARRLNRAEYNHTVRDLLHVDLRPADDFPVDDSGYGFDNNGDVLSTSPVLMEKYVRAAGKLARAAIWDRPRQAPPTRFRLQADRRQAGEPATAAIGEVAPFTPDGSMSLGYAFPATGAYRISFGAVDRRLRSPENGRYLNDVPAPPPRIMTMTLDGERIATKAVEAANGFDRSEQVARRIAAGTHSIWLGFVDSNAEPMNPNLEYAQRRLWVDFLEINGPFDADARPLPESHRRIVICTPDAEEPWRPCMRRLLAQLLRRAFRRPATARQIDRFMQLAERAMKNGAGFESAVQLALQAVLVSPEFLFRIERDPHSEDEDGVEQIDAFELASRLSYFLWSSMPDDELLDAAEQGGLNDSDELQRQVRRMLDSPKSTAFVENFAGQWLQLRNLAQASPDAALFPEFDGELRAAMKRETELFFAAVVREDRSLLEFLDSDFTFLNERLARHYGIDGVEGDEFRKVALTDSRRGGLLSHAGILTVSSYPTRTSPVLRGLWVMENLLGQAPPPPPPDVPELEESELGIGGTLREQLEKHRADENCASCHRVMDAIGFGLENYDPIGRWRTHEGKLPLDVSGEVAGRQTLRVAGRVEEHLARQRSECGGQSAHKEIDGLCLGTRRRTQRQSGRGRDPDRAGCRRIPLFRIDRRHRIEHAFSDAPPRAGRERKVTGLKRARACPKQPAATLPWPTAGWPAGCGTTRRPAPRRRSLPWRRCRCRTHWKEEFRYAASLLVSAA